MPTPRSHLGTAVVNNKIYAVGGSISKPDRSLATFEVYDPQKDKWSFLPNMPTKRQCVSASVVDGKIYVIGGTTEQVPWPGFQTVEVYIPN
jgi:N-acetylneuraminic acid mutarotase